MRDIEEVRREQKRQKEREVLLRRIDRIERDKAAYIESADLQIKKIRERLLYS